MIRPVAVFLVMVALFSWPILLPQSQSLDPAYHSPIALVADSAGKTLYVADETRSDVIQVDVASGNVVRNISLPGPPTGLAINKASNRLYVTLGFPSNSVQVLDLSGGTAEPRIAAGHTPGAPVLSLDESTLYVCNRFRNDISLIDLGQGRETKRISVLREPVAAALTPDGKTLIVGNARPDGPATAAHVSSAISLIDTRRNELVSTVPLLNGGVDVRGIAASPDNRYAFVSHVLARFHAPATQLDKGWLTTNAVGVIDLERRSLLHTILLDQVGRGAGNPWGVACTRDGRRLCVALSGVHELGVVDLPELLKRLETLPPAGGASQDPQSDYRTLHRPDTDLRFLQNYLIRVPLKGKGPRSLALAGGRAFTGMYYSGTVESVDLERPQPESSRIPLGSQPPPNEIRQGDLLFHDATVSQQGWQSCSTCHFDGRADGLNWDLTNDGIGNAKNTKSLVFSHATPPVTWTGVFPTLDDCVPYEIKTILFASRPKQDAAAIVAFLKSMRPVPSPHLVNGELGPAARRGERVFQKALCVNCHSGEYRTAMESRDIGTSTPADRMRTFDIPTLREVWRTAPYLHDGRAATVKDIFTKFDPANLHGKHAGLTPAELDDLAEYVLSQ